MRNLTIIFLFLFAFSCTNKQVQQKEVVILPVSNAKISEGKSKVFDTINFYRTDAGLHFVMYDSLKSGDVPDFNSHVTIEYKIVSKDGELVHQVDSTNAPFQLYVKDCNALLAEALSLLTRQSDIKIILDSDHVKELYSKAKKNENYLVDIRLIDFHQHYD